MADLDVKQQVQEGEYEFPYHYIPTWENGRFSQLRYWKWGFRYLGGLRLVLDRLESMSFDSAADVGCGDGRFLKELKSRFPNKELLGIDYSQNAVALASLLNPGGDFETWDITIRRAQFRRCDTD